MDGRSITSRYDFSESDSESFHSVHSGQGRTARTVSFARRYVSTVSLFSLRKKDSKMGRGLGVRNIASERFMREKNEAAEPRPTTSYMFSLGKEHDGQVEIIPECTPYDEDADAKYDDLVEVIPATTDSESDATNTEGISYQQWRHSALLPLPGKHSAARPGTGASSIYSRNIDDCASSIYSQESCGTARTRIVGRNLKTRSLLSLAKKYSAPDDAEMYSRYGCGVLPVTSPAEDGSLHDDDDLSVHSRNARTVPLQRRPSTRAGTISSTHSLPTPDRSSWHTKPLPALPTESADQQTWLLPPSRDGPSDDPNSKIWWSRESAVHQRPSTRRSEARTSETSFRSYNEGRTTPRPSSWSWLSIDTALNDRASSVRSRRSVEPTILRGQRFLRSFSLRSSARSEPISARSEPAPEARQYPLSPPPSYRRVYKKEHDLPMEAGMDHAASATLEPGERESQQASWQDLLELPPLELPELPDEQRVFFYSRCGHLETDVESFENGPEIPGWCPQCSKGRQRRRKVGRRPLKSMLKSIAE